MSYICKICLAYTPVFHKKLFEMWINILYWKRLELLSGTFFQAGKASKSFPKQFSKKGGGKIHTPHEWVIPNLHFSNIWWNAITVGESSSEEHPDKNILIFLVKKVCKTTALLSVVLSVRDLSNSQNSSRLSYYFSLNEVLPAFSRFATLSLLCFISVKKRSTLYWNLKKKGFWIIPVKRTNFDVNLNIGTFWLISNIASEANLKFCFLGSFHETVSLQYFFSRGQGPFDVQVKNKNVWLITKFPRLRIQTLAINDSFIKHFMRPIAPHKN